MNDKFIVCRDELKKEKLLSQGFKLLNKKRNKKNEVIYTFINKSEISLKFSKEDNDGLEYTNKLYF